MKVFAALLCVSCLVLGVQSVLPHGSDYVGGFLCPLPEFTPPSDSDSPLECPSCIGHDSCEGETMLCCPTAPGCMSCVEGVASDGAGCMTEEEESVDPLSFQLDEEECEICLCLNGDLYCHELEEADSGCADLTEPVEGASCVYEGRNISPGELTRVQHEEECDICFCGNGVLFCRDCGPDVLCEHDGERLGLGETSISDNGCTLCTCLESGEVECVTIDSCVGVCVYNEQELDVGETVQSTDGCNECTCFEDGTVGCTERACVCENGEPLVYCFRSPCDGASCPAYPEATCEDDYCGGCNTRWELEGEDVTDRCFESPGPFEPVRIPTCPATELELCAADCSEDSPCSGDTQLCCGGCCRDPINLPSYEVPPVCPPDIVALSDDSDACDVECQLDDQCPGEKICCRSSCSSSCQYGRIPPNSCEVVREILEERDEAAGEDRVPLGRFLPGCLENGFFSPVQTWENYRWCVNVVTGEPISEAYTSADGAFTCPNCTIDGRTVFPGQSFNDDCNTCFCTDTGLSACTRQFCLDPCSLPVSPGTCEDREMRYFFNSESRLCEQFFYSGCGGNANRFTSAYDCLHACKPESVCLLDWEEGEACDDDADTPARDLFYYYDAEEGECETEVGYRCGGNGNRFQNGMDCLRTCDPDNPGPTDADGNSCWLIQCDIPFCGEGVQPVYSDEYCCPTCPSDVEECEDDDDFMCSDGSCIPEDWVCDGLRDCSDGSDEMGDDCDPSTIHCDFRCSENECVPDNHVCDGVLDCTNARDERGCTDDFVPGLPFYHPPAVCPDSSDNLGPCDISECQSDMECREDREEEDETEDEYEEDNGNDKMCCLNNCNQMSCTRPTTASPACRAVVQRLSANFSYIPQCDADGDYQPVQCTGEGTTRRCWCVNVRSGIPYTTFSSNDDLNCKRCSVGDSDDPMYAPGERYTAEDGCNTCLCTASGVSVCTRKACVEKSCEIGRLTLEHGETKELDCLACSCMYGRLNCSRRECEVEVVRETVQVEMTFSGELPTTEEGLEALERNVERSLLQLYRESMNLDESQVEVTEIREGSVIVVVVLEDTEDDTGANITVLVFQMEEDYNEGLLVIRSDAGEDALVPTEDFKAETVTQEEEEDDDDDFVWWHGLLIGIAVAAVILSVVFTVIMLFACFRKRDHRVKVDGNVYHEPGTVEKVPLDEKA